MIGSLRFYKIGKVDDLGKGYGFIEVEGESDVFFHINQWVDEVPLETIPRDALLEFEIVEGRRGPIAVKVRLKKSTDSGGGAEQCS